MGLLDYCEGSLTFLPPICLHCPYEVSFNSCRGDIASFDEKDTTIVVRTLLDNRVEQTLKGLCLRHNGTSVSAATTCLDRLSATMERVGDCALMLYKLGMRGLWRGS
ncbi:unnamed protein product [Prunus armeniaca]